MARAWICPDCGFKFAWGDGEYPGHWVYTHIDLAHPKEKENNMEEQMEQVWRSKDGKVTGSKEEVEAYLKSRNPLAGMHFPYYYSPGAGIMTEYKPGYGAPTELEEKNAVVAFANLAPLIQELDRHWKIRPYHFVGVEFTAIEKLLLAYEEALKQVPQ